MRSVFRPHPARGVIAAERRKGYACAMDGGVVRQAKVNPSPFRGVPPRLLGGWRVRPGLMGPHLGDADSATRRIPVSIPHFSGGRPFRFETLKYASSVVYQFPPRSDV